MTDTIWSIAESPPPPYSLSSLRFRSKQLEKYVKAMENQRVKMGTASGSSGGGVGPGGRELTPPGPYTAKRPQAITQEVSK